MRKNEKRLCGKGKSADDFSVRVHCAGPSSFANTIHRNAYFLFRRNNNNNNDTCRRGHIVMIITVQYHNIAITPYYYTHRTPPCTTRFTLCRSCRTQRHFQPFDRRRRVSDERSNTLIRRDTEMAFARAFRKSRRFVFSDFFAIRTGSLSVRAHDSRLRRRCIITCIFYHY